MSEREGLSHPDASVPASMSPVNQYAIVRSAACWTWPEKQNLSERAACWRGWICVYDTGLEVPDEAESSPQSRRSLSLNPSLRGRHPSKGNLERNFRKLHYSVCLSEDKA